MDNFQNAHIKIIKSPRRLPLTTRIIDYFDIAVLTHETQDYQASRLILEELLMPYLTKDFHNFSWHIENMRDRNDFAKAKNNSLAAFLQLVYDPFLGADITDKKSYIHNFFTQHPLQVNRTDFFRFISSVKTLAVEPNNDLCEGILAVAQLVYQPTSLWEVGSYDKLAIFQTLAKAKNNPYFRNKDEELYQQFLTFFFNLPEAEQALKTQKKEGYTCADIAAFNENYLFLQTFIQTYPKTWPQFFTKKNLKDYQIRNPELAFFLQSSLEKQQLEKEIDICISSFSTTNSSNHTLSKTEKRFKI